MAGKKKMKKKKKKKKKWRSWKRRGRRKSAKASSGGEEKWLKRLIWRRNLVKYITSVIFLCQ
jgi:hypothetical protein